MNIDAEYLKIRKIYRGKAVKIPASSLTDKKYGDEVINYVIKRTSVGWLQYHFRPLEFK